MKKKYILAISVFVIILIFVLYNSLFVHTKIETLRVQRGNLVTVVYATGNVTADTAATLRSESGGIVKYLNVLEGNSVKKGQLLMKTDQADRLLDVRQAENNLKTAKVELENEQKNFERKKSLRTSNTISQNEFDEAKKNFELSELKLQQQKILLDKAEENLSKTEIYAPFGGIVIASDVNLGDNLAPNSVCFRIVSPSSVLVEGEVDEQDLSKVSLGQKGIIAFDAFPGDKFDGFVYRIVPKTNVETKTSKVYLKLNNRPSNLNVGMTATINIKTGQRNNVLLIPRTSILNEENSKYVYLVKNNRLVKTVVEVGEDNSGKFTDLIGGDVKIGDIIAENPSEKWKNGMEVNPVIK